MTYKSIKRPHSEEVKNIVFPAMEKTSGNAQKITKKTAFSGEVVLVLEGVLKGVPGGGCFCFRLLEPLTNCRNQNEIGRKRGQTTETKTTVVSRVVSRVVSTVETTEKQYQPTNLPTNQPSNPTFHHSFRSARSRREISRSYRDMPNLWVGGTGGVIFPHRRIF
jgi:hypothetical protein